MLAKHNEDCEIQEELEYSRYRNPLFRLFVQRDPSVPCKSERQEKSDCR